MTKRLDLSAGASFLVNAITHVIKLSSALRLSQAFVENCLALGFEAGEEGSETELEGLARGRGIFYRGLSRWTLQNVRHVVVFGASILVIAAMLIG